jgi:3-oxo-5-alpha-steroid 4-dehydrogenase 1
MLGGNRQSGPEANGWDMGEIRLINVLRLGWFGLSAIMLAILLVVTAPYGRHNRPGWGPTVSARFGWITMEASSLVAFNVFYFQGNGQIPVAVAFFVILWNLHYLNRSFLYPMQMRYGSRPMAASVVLMAIFFNTVNGYLNGRYLNLYSPRYEPGWLLDPRFLLGFMLFIGGFLINNQSDGILRKLREPGQDSYRKPEGGMFRYVSCANYLGEIIEWFGWACMTWSWVGLSFAVWTACNLIPRALSHHKWYLSRFSAYPAERKAIIPFLL